MINLNKSCQYEHIYKKNLASKIEKNVLKNNDS
jgi:hypothetical protein